MTELSLLEGHPLLHLNSVASIRIKGLSKDNFGQDHELMIPRAPFLAPKTSVYHTATDTRYLLRERPHPPQSTLPPPGNLELELELGDVLSGPSVYHTVYKVNVVSSGGKSPDVYIPPLVLKVAHERRGRTISEEGGMYNHLESLQGVVMPRCYGYFQTVIDHTKTTVLPWDGNCVYPRDENKFDIFRMPNAHACLAVLLLEQVGGPVTGIPKDEVQSDLHDMTEELAHLGVQYDDWKVANVLMAPEVPPGLPGTASSRQAGNRVYRLRLIDFEDALWTNNTPHHIMTESNPRLTNVVQDIAELRCDDGSRGPLPSEYPASEYPASE